MTRLLLSAGGKHENEVVPLPGGHCIDMACEIRYGIIGEAVTPDQKKEKR